MRDQSWKDGAACAQADDAELWFPEGETAKFRQQIHEAKAVCVLCPVRGDCLAYATDNNLRDGVWGGMTPNERKNAIRRRQRLVAKVTAL